MTIEYVESSYGVRDRQVRINILENRLRDLLEQESILMKELDRVNHYRGGHPRRRKIMRMVIESRIWDIRDVVRHLIERLENLRRKN